MQIAIKTGVDDQFPSLGALRLLVRNTRSSPFDNVDDLMGSLEDLSFNQKRATASARLAGGGMMARSKSYNLASRSQQFWGCNVCGGTLCEMISPHFVIGVPPKEESRNLRGYIM